ncbi:NUDIX hydrolase [Acidihalobacter prosperus]
MRFKPHVTVAAIVENGGHFLMVRENIEGQICYNQPAGHLEASESLVDAVIRETLEETAWVFHPQALIGIYRWMHPSGATYLRAAFAGDVSDHDNNRELDTGIEAAEWFKPQEIISFGKQLRTPLVLRCLEDYQAGKRYSLDLIRDFV